jgi:aminocarboxymuconate-semialdehyde decarboxylase
MGIEIQAISPAPVQMYYWAEPDLGLATAHRQRTIADIVGRHPDRFAGMGTVPLQMPELAIGELERLVNSLGMRGTDPIGFIEGARGLSADDRKAVFGGNAARLLKIKVAAERS